MNWLPLSDEERARVHAVLRNGADPETLKSRAELHYAARSWNWDDGVSGLLTITRQPACDKGTAQLIYWAAMPVDTFADYTTREEAEADGAAEVFDLLVEIEARALTNDFATAEIGFNPAQCEGTDLTTGWDTLKRRPIPEAMTRPADGLVANPGIRF